jgi:hypothetical protein
MSLLCLYITVAIAWLMLCGHMELDKSRTRSDQHISACHACASHCATFEVAVVPRPVPRNRFATEDTGPFTHGSNIPGQSSGLFSNHLCTAGSNAPRACLPLVADMPCGPSHTHPTQARSALGTAAQTQLVRMDQSRVPGDMLDDQPCAWHDKPASAEGPRVAPRPMWHSNASQGAGDPAAAAVKAQWTLFLIACTLLTAAVALSCVRCGLSALVCCAATGPVGLLLSGTVFVLCLLEVRSSR